jgi:hypothetical protein
MEGNSSIVLLDSVECEQLRLSLSNTSLRPENRDRPVGVVVNLAIFWLVVSLLSIFLLIFAGVKYLHPRRKELFRLQHRPVINIFLGYLGIVFMSLCGDYFQGAELRAGLPCWLSITASTLAVPLIVFLPAARLLQLYRKRQWTENALEVVSKDRTGTSSNKTRMSVVTLRRRVVVLMSLMFFTDRCFARTPRASHAITDTERSTNDRSRTSRERTQMLRVLKSEWATNVILAIAVLPYVINGIVASLGNEFVQKGCYGCAGGQSTLFIALAGMAVAQAVLLGAMWLNLGTKDPYGFVHETKCMLYCGGIEGLFFFLVHTALRPQMLKSNFQFLMLIDLSLIVMASTQTILQVALALRDLHRTTELSREPLMRFSLEQFAERCLIKGAPLYDAFKAHLESEYSYESLAFIENATQWEQAYYDLGPQTARIRAKAIANMFIGDHAELPCNLSAEVSGKILAQLERVDDDKKVSPELFKDALEELTNMIYRDAFPRFLASVGFQKARVSIAPAGSGGLIAA